MYVFVSFYFCIFFVFIHIVVLPIKHGENCGEKNCYESCRIGADVVVNSVSIAFQNVARGRQMWWP